MFSRNYYFCVMLGFCLFFVVSFVCAENGEDKIQNTDRSSKALKSNTLESLHSHENKIHNDDGEFHSTEINATELNDLLIGESSNTSKVTEIIDLLIGKSSNTSKVTEIIDLPISDSSNNSEISKQNNPNLLQANLSAHDGNLVFNNFTDEKEFGTKSSASVNRRQAYDFRDLLINLLNVSQTEKNLTVNRVNSTSRNSSFKGNSNRKLYPNKPDNSVTKNNESNHLNVPNTVHGRSTSSQNLVKEEDLQKGYAKLDVHSFQKAKAKALQWLIDARNKDYGWGEETARALIALYTADNVIGKLNEKALFSKEIHLKLLTLFYRNEIKTISPAELALYINALSASCNNPRNFYGHDLVNVLRNRTNFAQESSEYITPFIYLVLCLHNASSYADVRRVEEMLYSFKIPKIDNESVMSLAATCLSRIPKFFTNGIEQIAARILYQKVASKGLPENIYELALLTQALNEAKVNQDLWNRTEAMSRIIDFQGNDGSFGDILSTYYALPTLSGKSFLWIGKDCPNNYAGLTPMDVLKNGLNPKINVHYSLLFGNPVEISQSVMLQVQMNTSFIDIMRIASTTNSVYQFKYDVNEGIPTVYSIGGITNDAERGLYWKPYTSQNFTIEQGSMVPFEGDIRTFIPSVGEHLAFWRKSMF